MQKHAVVNRENARERERVKEKTRERGRVKERTRERENARERERERERTREKENNSIPSIEPTSSITATLTAQPFFSASLSITVDKLTSLQYEILPHPPYSPDISPTDYYLLRIYDLPNRWQKVVDANGSYFD
ncbi:Histone-lysine N-methyltransferase SETMAR [Anthophora quadrimaculata]